MKNVSLFGVNIATGSREELLFSVSSLIGTGGTVFTPNPVILDLACREAEFFGVLSHSSVNIPDGVGIKLALARQGVKTDTLPGVELGEELVAMGHTFAIIGGKEGVAKIAGERLEAKYPSSRCLFTRSGYGYNIEEFSSLLALHQPQLCFVCLGAPKQELLTEKLLPSSDRTLYLALGGSVDVYAGTVRRAPAMFKRLGAEWLWRMLREPVRFKNLPAIFRFAGRTLIRHSAELNKNPYK